MIIVDTSVLIGLLRGKDTPAVAKLRELERHQARVHLPEIVCQEILQGARDVREWKRIEDVISTQYVIETSDSKSMHWRAARIYFDARRKGLTIRSTVDCIIAQLALDYDALLLHDDTDFKSIAKVRPLQFAL